MNNVLKLTKKAFTVSVVVTTIMWSLGVAALVPSVAQAAADCPALAAGQMIKAGGPGIWVVGTNLTSRTYFPHGDVYKSWTADNAYTFTSVSDACLASLTPAGAVLPRSGTTVVREVSAPSVNYVVLPGKKLQQISDAAAKALYGADYATLLKSKNGYNEYKNMVVVSDADWGYYNTGSNKVSGELTETIPHEGMLVSNSGKTYYVDAGKVLREVTDTGFTANKFQTKDVMALASVAGYTMGTALAAQEAKFTDHGVAVEAAPTTPAATTGNLGVSLSANTPAGGNVVINVDNVVFGKFILKATNGDYSVSSVKIGRKGLGAKADFTSVTLYDGATKLGSSKTSWDSNAETTVYNIPTGWTIANGTSKELTVVAKMATSGTYNALGILAVNGTDVSPVYGNEMTGVSVTVGTVTITNMATASTKKIGTNATNLAEFKLALSSVENGSFQAITLKNKGTAADTDVANLYLYKGATKLAGPVSMKSDKVSFNLDTPVSIEKSKKEVFKVTGDVVDGNANTVEFLLDNTTDLKVVGATYGTSLSVTSGDYNTVGDSAATTTISGAELNLAYTGTNLDTVDDVTDVNFGTLTLSAGSTDIKITSLNLNIDETEASGSAGVLDVDNFEMVEVGGGAYSGSQTAGADNNDTTEVWNFDDEIYLSAGQTRKFTLQGDLPDSVANGDSYKVTATINGTNVVAETVPAGDTVTNFSIGSFTGMTVTVKTPTLKVAGLTQNSGTAVVNDTDVILYKGTLEAQASDIHVTYANFDSDSVFSTDNWTQVGFYLVNADGSYDQKQLLTNSQMTTGTLSFDSLDFTVKNGPTNKATFVVKGTVAASLNSATVATLKLDYFTAKAADNSDPSIIDGSSNDLSTSGSPFLTTGQRQVTLADKGKLFVQMRNNDAGFNKDRVVLAGTGFWAGKIKFRADDESVKVKDLKLTNIGNASDAATSVCLYTAQEVSADKLISCTTMDSNGVVFYDDIDKVVAQSTVYWYIYVNTAPMNNLAGGTADTHDQFQFAIASTSGHLAVEGVRSGFAYTYGANDGSAVAAGEFAFDYDLDESYNEAGDARTASTTNFYVTGSKISNVQLVSSYGGETVNTSLSGTGEYTAAILAITTENNSNTDSNGNALKLGVAALRFDIAKFASTTLSGATIKRIGGSSTTGFSLTGSTGDNDLTKATTTAGSYTLSTATTSIGTDAYVEPGQTAYYVVKVTVDGLNAGDNIVNWFRVDLNDLSGTYNTDTDNNVDWYSDVVTADTPWNALLLDTTNITGTKVAEAS